MSQEKNLNDGIRPAIKELLALKHHAAGIQFFNNRKVHSVQAGMRLSPARGRGMDFEEVRHYQSGDDVRLIHWSLTARLGKPFTKIYREERERSIYLVIDQSSAMHFGTRVCFKNVLAAKVAALLGFAALDHHEQVGGIIFNDKNAEYIQPKRSRQPLLQMFNILHNNQGIKHYQGGLENNLQLLSQKIQSGSVVIIISDFNDYSANVKNFLNIINRKAEIINVFIYDPLESNLPDHGYYNFTDDGKRKLEISATKNNRHLYSNNFNERLSEIENFSRKNRMQFVKLATNDNLVEKINHGILKYGY